MFSVNVVVPPVEFLSKLEIVRHCRPPSRISEPVLPLGCASCLAILTQTLFFLVRTSP